MSAKNKTYSFPKNKICFLETDLDHFEVIAPSLAKVKQALPAIVINFALAKAKAVFSIPCSEKSLLDIFPALPKKLKFRHFDN